ETAQLAGGAPQVLGRAGPQGHCRDTQVDAPGEALVELCRPDPVGVHRVPALRPGPATVSVEDDAHVAGHGAMRELGLEPSRVEPVQKAAPARVAARWRHHSRGRRAVRGLYSAACTPAPRPLTSPRRSTPTP